MAKERPYVHFQQRRAAHVRVASSSLGEKNAMFGNRSISTAISALFQRRHYKAAKNMLLRCAHPADAFKRYALASGDYPVAIPVKTPLGVIRPTIYSHDDMLTINEIFCREDYACPDDVNVIVDFGSNIGLSALYFLTRNADSFAYLFEPLPRNVERLQRNLRGYERRYALSPVAVSLADGEAEFGYEETGRYGGVGLQHGQSMRVRCRAAASLLKVILEKHTRIDVLKIDIESLETEILLSLSLDILQSIKFIFVEQRFRKNPLEQTHEYIQYGNVARFQKGSFAEMALP